MEAWCEKCSDSERETGLPRRAAVIQLEESRLEVLPAVIDALDEHRIFRDN